ncbi:MAG: TIGR01212 family radical SAM protein [Bacteroidales bacterium]|nr:TIGR01212 family radical SAM protein [Bacteroidales bacterium]
MYRDYASYIKEKFGTRVQKIALNPGFNCPNRDGKIGLGGCTYCNNQTFSPFYVKGLTPTNKQLEQGIAFFSKKYKCQKYIAYFQSYTNTYADIETLEKIYYQALNNENVIGLTVATRPDCIDENVLKLLQKISEKYYTVLELGVESCYDKTLKMINRGHTFCQAEQAIKKAATFGLELCAHLIMYLPGETEEMMLKTADIMSALPVKILKLHQLQIIKGTKMEQQFKENPELFSLPSADEYADFVAKYISKTRPDMIFERFISESPMQLIVAPKWNGIKNKEFLEKLKKRLEK